MSLRVGSQLGPFEISSVLGAGGMGEVFRAHDTRLKRDVAIKILPEAFTSDALRRSRFEQEARAIAALSHPNIVAIYDVGENYIVSELIDGEPLRAAIRHGPMSPRRVVEIAAQIADGLAAAHAAGIIHRDIKPENIMLTRDGRVKLLDFGLAKPELRNADPSATLPLTSTDPGTVVGTVAYMSPEQVRSQPLDHRSDIFSLGIVLHEMLAGSQPFRGGSSVEIMNAVLTREPPELPDSTPPVLVHVVRRCLEKEPQARFQSASDLAFALRTASGSGLRTGSSPPAGRKRDWVRFAIAAILIAACALAAWRYGVAGRPARAESWVLTRLTYDTGLTTDPALSPDGKLVAYSSDRAGATGMDLWLQHLSGGSAIQLTKDSGDETEPDFSPDGGRIVFRSNREGGGIYVVPVLGGEPVLIAPGGFRPRFSPDGTKVAYWTGALGSAFLSTVRQVYVAPVSGGGSSIKVSGDYDGAYPTWSADGRKLLFAATGFGAASADWYIVDPDGNSLRPLNIAAAFESRGLGPFASPPGHWRDGYVTFAGRAPQQFQSRLWRVSVSSEGAAGAVEPLTNGTGFEDKPSVSASGIVALSSETLGSDVWMLKAEVNKGKAQGEPVRLTHGPATEMRTAISGDGTRLAYVSNRTGNADIWLRELRTGTETALTTTAADEGWPALSQDGSRLMYTVGETAFTVALPRGRPEKICGPCGPAVWDVSENDRYVLVNRMEGTPPDFATSAVDTVNRVAFTVAAHEEWQVLSPRFSADAQWVAFHVRNTEMSRRIYAAPFQSRAADAAVGMDCNHGRRRPRSGSCVVTRWQSHLFPHRSRWLPMHRRSASQSTDKTSGRRNVLRAALTQREPLHAAVLKHRPDSGVSEQR